MVPHAFRIQIQYLGWKQPRPNLYRLRVAGVVFTIDSDTVVKVSSGTPQSIEGTDTERRACCKFVRARCHIPVCLDTENPNGVVSERYCGSGRSRVAEEVGDDTLSNGIIRKWAKEPTKGLAVAHDCKVIQGDFGCHNMLLDSTDNVSLIDFGGSSVDGSIASVDYEPRSRLPRIGEPTEKTDIFALGCAIYEISTGTPPYARKSHGKV